MARPTLKGCLDRLWQDPLLWQRGSELNWLAFDATYCMKELLQLGETSDSLRKKYEQLLKHPNHQNREVTIEVLSGLFPKEEAQSTHGEPESSG